MFVATFERSGTYCCIVIWNHAKRTATSKQNEAHTMNCTVMDSNGRIEPSSRAQTHKIYSNVCPQYKQQVLPTLQLPYYLCPIVSLFRAARVCAHLHIIFYISAYQNFTMQSTYSKKYLKKFHTTLLNTKTHSIVVPNTDSLSARMQ